MHCGLAIMILNPCLIAWSLYWRQIFKISALSWNTIGIKVRFRKGSLNGYHIEIQICTVVWKSCFRLIYQYRSNHSQYSLSCCNSGNMLIKNIQIQPTKPTCQLNIDRPRSCFVQRCVILGLYKTLHNRVLQKNLRLMFI